MEKKVLGLDLGTNSIGWCLTKQQQDENRSYSITYSTVWDYFMKTYAFTTLIASIFLLSGCTGEPSEQDIYTAMNKVVEQTNAIVKSIAGKDVPKDALRELKSVKKHDCVKVSDKSYKCNVTAVVDNEKRTAAVTLVKTDDGWQVVDK